MTQWVIPACLCLVCLPAVAQDWPQILGPQRSGRSEMHPALSTAWPPELQIRWQVGLGSGYGGAAIVGDRVFAMDRLGNQEILEAIDLASGKKLWQSAWDATYRASISPDSGPRCVPTISAGKAVCYGAAGDLVCVDIRDGQILWQRPLRQEYSADDGYFGAGASPLVVDDLVVVCLGGRQAGVVGIDLNSGQTRWAATSYDASYAAPIAVDRKTALVVTRLRTVLIDLTNGSVSSEVLFGGRGPTVNAATPIAVGDNQYLLTASYGIGASMLTLRDGQLSEVFRESQLISSQYNTPIRVGDRVIGIDGREDAGVASLVAVNLQQEKTLWKQAEFGMAHLIGVGSQVIALGLNGRLALLDGAADEFRLLAQVQLPSGDYRALPALSNGQLVVRNSNDSTGRSQLMCLQLPLASSGP